MIRDELTDRQIPFRTYGEHHHARVGWIQLDCPFCSPESSHFRLGYNLEGNYCCCWSCGYRPVVSTFSLILKEPYYKVKEILGGIQVEEPEHKERGKLSLPLGLGPLKKQHIQYLKERGLDHDRLEKLWKIRGIGIAPRLSWRVFIPIFHHGKMVSWTTRSISKTSPRRYISASPQQESVPIKSVLFGEDFVRNTAIVCEGPFDTFRIGPGAMATLGTSYSRSQLYRISNIPIRYVCFDSEPTAQERARILCQDLAVLPGRTVNLTLDAKDPGSASEKELNQLRRLLE